MNSPIISTPIVAFLPLTRLNENDSVMVMRDAIDCIEPFEVGLAGCILHLRGGHVLRIKESVEHIMEALQ